MIGAVARSQRNPMTGKLDTSIYDANHYVGSTFDPCHCYDPCGPQQTCPIVVDAGPPPADCDGGPGLEQLSPVGEAETLQTFGDAAPNTLSQRGGQGRGGTATRCAANHARTPS